jgi:hypothetical protein
MAKKKKFGSLGPQPWYLKLSRDARDKLKQNIKEGLQGYVRPDGIAVPGARRIYKGLGAADGFDLRHIERWSAATYKKARERVQSLNTLTGRPFAVIIPRTKKQRVQGQKFTGQNLPYQKEFIVQVQDPKHDKAVFRENKVTIQRDFKGGSREIEQRWLFRDYLEPGESMPITFAQMRDITLRMLPFMPAEYRKQWVYYTILTVQYGSVGQSVPKHRILELLSSYHSAYDVKKGFAEAVIGFNMVGTYKATAAYQILREHLPSKRKQMKKLRFSKRRKMQMKKRR